MADPQNPQASTPLFDMSKATPVADAAPSQSAPANTPDASPQPSATPLFDMSRAVTADTPVAAIPPDPDLANHPILQKLDRGLRRGTLQGLGLHPDDQGHVGGLMDALGQTVSGIKNSAIQSFHNLGGDTSDTDKPHFGQTLLNEAAIVGTPFDMIGTGINGMAHTIEDGASDIKKGISASGGVDHETIAQGAGKIIAALGQIFMGSEKGAATEVIKKMGDATEAAGTVVDKNATRPANGLVRAKTARSYSYGKNPGQTILDENIKPTNSLENLQKQVEDSQTNLGNQVRQVLTDPSVAQRTVNAAQVVDTKMNEVLNKIADEKGLQNRQGVIDAIKQIRKDIVGIHDADGNMVGMTTGPRTLVEANEMKKSVGRNTRWNNDPEISQYANDFRKGAYGALNDAVENEVQSAAKNNPNNPLVQSVKALNQRYANSIEFERLLKDRVVKEANADVGLNNFLKKGAFWTGMTYLLGGGHPLLGGAILANEAIRTPIGRIINTKMQSAAGGALQDTGTAMRGAGPAAAAQGASVAASGQGGTVRIKASDGSLHDIPAQSLDAAKQRDPQLQIIQ